MTSAKSLTDCPSGCAACASAGWAALPVPGPRSMLSDGRLVERPLARADCETCGLAGHADPLDPEELGAYFREGYGLYAHEPGRGPERARQAAYARWIAASMAPERVGDMLEVGCGNGSLLLELRRLFPSARLRGVEPSAAAVEQARAAGLDVRPGFGEEVAPEFGGQDLVISVNVIEHSPDPARFLTSLARLTKPDGHIVVVCPDGSEPSTELLFFDHVFSLTAAAVARFAARAGLGIERSMRAPSALGPFRLYVLSASAPPAPPVSGSLHASRAAYLLAWKTLDRELLARTAGARTVTALGSGEAALLLRAYAPGLWSRVRRVTVDTKTEEWFCGLPVEALGELDVAQGEVLLLAVRPPDQRMLAERLGGRWERLIRWDDIVAF
jgi:SAM-dependent methyltransferase